MYCRNCGGTLATRAVKCMSCGAAPRTGSKHCWSCGVACASDARSCTKCDVALIPDALARPPRSASTPRSAPAPGATPTPALAASARSRATAGLLSLLLPLIAISGVGRIYLGYTKLGLIQLVVGIFTCGVGGLWSLIDGIRILLGKPAEDADGRPLR